MYVTIHTITIVDNNWVVEAHLIETATPSRGNCTNVVTKRVILNAFPLRSGSKCGKRPIVTNVKGISKRKNSIRHYVRTVKMYVVITIFRIALCDNNCLHVFLNA